MCYSLFGSDEHSCLVSPFMSEGEIRFGSKGGLTDVSKFIEQTFLRKHPEMDYMGLRYY